MNALALILTFGGGFLLGLILYGRRTQRRYDAEMLELDSLLQTARQLHMTDYEDQIDSDEIVIVGKPPYGKMPFRPGPIDN